MNSHRHEPLPPRTYNLRVNRRSSVLLDHALRSRKLSLTDECISGFAGAAVYRPSESALSGQCGLDERALWLGAELQVELWRLPMAPYGALVGASPGMRQFAAAGLLKSLGAAMDPDAARRWWLELARVAAAGPQPGLTVQLASTVTDMVWSRGSTRLVRVSAGWFASLSFDVPHQRRPAGGRRAMGLDVGLDPLAALVTSASQVTVAGVRVPDRCRVLQEPPGTERLALRDLLVAAATRAALEEATQHIEEHALFVALERLQFGTFTGNFPARARQLCVADWIFADLPQRLHAAGIDLTYVRPAGTSSRCSRCGSSAPGQRRGRAFTCVRCGHAEQADLNAARNILQRARGQRRRQGLRW